MLVIGPFGKGRPSVDQLGASERAAISTVRAYWEGLRTAGGLPSRDQIDPRGLASALEHVFLVERVAPGHARFRLAGNLFHDLMDMDVRGMPFSAMFEPVGRARLQPLLDEVFCENQALHLTLEAERGIGRPALSAKVMLLPLRMRPQEPGVALGVLATTGAIGRAPRRFHISTSRLELVLPPETREFVLRKETLAPEHGSAGEFQPLQSTRKSPQTLRLVHSRDD